MIVVWRITQRCNLSCPFCAYDHRVQRPRREVEAGIVRQFGAVLSEYQRETGDAVLVSWIGGEPFLFPHLDELTIFLAKQLGLKVSATTNGTTLGNPTLREHLIENYEELTVSVDGIGPVHDGLRGWDGGYEALRLAVTALSDAKRANGSGPRLRANVVLMRQTIGEFERLCVELSDWGIEEVTFNQLGGRDRPDFFPSHRLLGEQTRWLNEHLPGIRARLAKRGVVLKGSNSYLARIQASSRDEAMPVRDCLPGEQFLFISENGVVSPCHFTTEDYGVSVTELAEPQALRALPLRFAQAQRERRSVLCEDCHSTRVFDKFTA